MFASLLPVGLGLVLLGAPAQETPGWDVASALTTSVSHPQEVHLADLLREVRARAFDLGEVPESILAEVEAIGRTDPGAFEAALAMLCERTVPETDLGPAQVLSLVQEAVCLELFARGPKGKAGAAIDRFWADARASARKLGPHEVPSRAETDAVLLATGALGRPADLQFLLSLAPEQPTAMGAYQRALLCMLTASPESYDRLRAHWLGLTPIQLSITLMAVMKASDSRALPFLEDVMHWSEEARPEAAGVVRGLGRSVDPKLNESLSLYLVDMLDAESTSAVRAAADALAVLRCESALDPLIDALARNEERAPTSQLGTERQAIVAALRATAKRSLPAEARTWRLWLRDELTWRSREAPRLIRQLRQSDPVLVIDALRQLSRHPVGREAHGELILPLLASQDAVVASHAAQALVELDVPSAVPVLISHLETSPARPALEDALTQLSGWAKEPDVDAWRARLAATTSSTW